MTTKEIVNSLSKEELETLKKLLNAYKEDKKENDDRSRDRIAGSAFFSTEEKEKIRLVIEESLYVQ